VVHPILNVLDVTRFATEFLYGRDLRERMGGRERKIVVMSDSTEQALDMKEYEEGLAVV